MNKKVNFKLKNISLMNAVIGSNGLITRKTLGYTNEDGISAYINQVVTPILKTTFWPNSTSLSQSSGYFSECNHASNELIKVILNFIDAQDDKKNQSQSQDSGYIDELNESRIQMARIQKMENSYQ